MVSVLVSLGAVLICALLVVGAGWPTISRKVRRAFVFGPALAWAAAAALGLSFAIVLPLWSQTVTTLLVSIGFAGVGIWSVLQTVRAAREAISDPLEPLFEARPRFTPRPRQPLTEAESNLARDWLGAFQATKLLEADEVTLSEVLGHSEHDDQFPYDLGNFLNALCSAKQQYRHLAFFFDGVEFSTEDAIDIVMEFARLAGRDAGHVELEPIGATREDRGQDFVITFDLDGRRHQMRFTMYAKALPWGLIDALRDRVRPDGDERTFEIAWSEAPGDVDPHFQGPEGGIG